MTASEIRRQFLDFFASKGHKIVPSAPIVNKNDPTLMFTNSGMVQFKDFFLGNREPAARRVADTQKCLRVSGKHNDLEDVGYDGYHHTMFEMLGNWSFGDYFKKEAIEWSWELLTEVYKLPKDRLYATVFEGDAKENLPADGEARALWQQFLPDGHILFGNKKDNFWEMGETGPCGPCSEIHIDLRPDSERAQVPGSELVNRDHPQVIEIWNNVFMQFNRKADGSLEVLPAQHVDTGMGFERLVRAIENKTSNYDTNIFRPLIGFIEKETGLAYTDSYDPGAKTDIAMRVLADHLRAVSFVIGDGQLPSNTGAGYVVRRILRRAVRYYFSFLGVKEPFLHRLFVELAKQFRDIFPELELQRDFIGKVILEEEKSFLRTLELGLKRLDELPVENGILNGSSAFELYDTYGFPIDLTRLIGRERGFAVDEAGFDEALEAQKKRSRAATARSVGDWTEVLADPSVTFVGYDRLDVEDARVVKYRTVQNKGREEYQVVLNVTPFYPEGGGQVGDRGWLYIGDEPFEVLDTKKENDLIIHFVDRLSDNMRDPVRGMVDARKRQLTSNNHTATHLVHAALRQVLGTHVQQKGSLVNEDNLRFDFAHFQKVNEAELSHIEQLVNEKIRANIPLQEFRNLPLEEARQSGAMMLFGEKYGETVRMIVFDEHYSKELCGGTHVPNTGQLGLFKFKMETAVAAGVRRIEAVTAQQAESYVHEELGKLRAVREALKNPVNLLDAVDALYDENRHLRKQVEKMHALQARLEKEKLLRSAVQHAGATVVVGIAEVESLEALRIIAQELRRDHADFACALGAVVDGKPQLLVAASDSLVAKGFHAGNIVKEAAKHIQGGGGGRPNEATAGGKDAAGLELAVRRALEMIAV
jgi:alanyl-tRNA synthetase